MYFFNFNVKKALLIFCAIVLPVILVILDRNVVESHFLFRSLSYINNSVQTAFQNTSSAIRKTTSLYLNLVSIRKTNRHLEKENKKLKARLKFMQEIQIENKRLKNIINFRQNTPLKLLLARVTGRDPVSGHQLITINRGKNQGIAKQMMVINEVGFVGYIYRVFNNFSQVILLTNPQASLSAVIQRSRVQGMLEGGPGQDKCYLKFLKRRDDVKTGDIVATADLNTGLKTGFPIGKVVHISKKKYGPALTAEIQPFINPSELEEVLIVLNLAKKPAQPL